MNVEHSQQAFGMWLWQQSTVNQSLFRALYLQQLRQHTDTEEVRSEVIGLREMAKVELLLAGSWRNAWMADHSTAANSGKYVGPFNVESEGIDA